MRRRQLAAAPLRAMRRRSCRHPSPRMESQRIRLIEMRCKSAQIARDLGARDAMKTENSPGGA